MAIKEQTKERIRLAREYLLGSHLSEPIKDGLGSLLEAAETAANGTENKINSLADAFLLLVIHEVRQAVRFPDVVTETIKKHESVCLLRNSLPPGKLGIFLQCIRSWPLAIVVSVLVVSGHLPAILELLFKHVFK